MKKELFESTQETKRRKEMFPTVDTLNNAGGLAYKLEDKHALAQVVASGFLGGTFYVDAVSELKQLIELANKCDPEYIAKCALYGSSVYMKDTPIVLLAYLSHLDISLAERIFDRIVRNGKLLRNYMRVMRSGVFGKTIPRPMRRKVRAWLRNHDCNWLFKNSIGNDPSFVDVIKMIHPKPATPEENAFYAYMIGKEYNVNELPSLVKQFEDFKKDSSGDPPDVPFQMLSSLKLSPEQWLKLALQGGYHFLRMNLNTLARNNVFKIQNATRLIAQKLYNEDEIRKARIFPYQLYTSAKFISDDVPGPIGTALNQALEFSLSTVPVLPDNTKIYVDVSGSMSWSITGDRGSATSNIRCVDVAALFGCACLRANPKATIKAVDTSIHNVSVTAQTPLRSAIGTLASYGGGGTHLGLAFRDAIQNPVDLMILVSDNESWLDNSYKMTESMDYWNLIKKQNPNAKLVCINLAVNPTTQVKERKDIMNIGGFSDAVFDIVAEFAYDRLSPEHWVELIEKQEV